LKKNVLTWRVIRGKHRFFFVERVNLLNSRLEFGLLHSSIRYTQCSFHEESMYLLQEQFKSDALAQLNSKVQEAQVIAGNMLEVTRDIGVLNIRTTKASAEALASTAQKLLSARDPVEFFQLAVSAMRPDVQAWTMYAEQLRGIAGKISLPLKASIASAPALPQSAVTWPNSSPATPAVPQETVPQAAVADEAIVAEAVVAPPVVPKTVEAEPVIAESAVVESVIAQPVLTQAAQEPVTDTKSAAPTAPATPAASSMPAAASPAARDDLPPVADASQPDVPEAIQDVADAMVGVSKTPPVVMAASAPLPKTPAAPPEVPKAAIAQATRKASGKSAPQKTNASARSSSTGREKKG
jgi:hypothetical protein